MTKSTDSDGTNSAASKCSCSCKVAALEAELEQAKQLLGHADSRISKLVERARAAESIASHIVARLAIESVPTGNSEVEIAVRQKLQLLYAENAKLTDANTKGKKQA